MTTKEPINNLAQIGLDERAQKVYLALLELGADSVQHIAKKARVERTGVYGVIQELVSLGLVSESHIGKKRIFVAENPNRLNQLLLERQQAVAALVPDLLSLWQATDLRPRIRYFEGEEGMRAVIDDTLMSPDKNLVGILSAEDLFSAVGERWFERYTRERIDKGFSLRVIRSKQKELGERWPTSAKQRRELRYAPAAMIFSMTMYIYGTKVAFLSTRRENFGMIIESDEFATHQRYLFDALWQIAKPGPKTD